MVLPLTTSCLGFAYALSGRIAEGLPLLEQAVEQAAGVLRAWQSPVIINLGRGYLLAGRVEDAMRLAESALELTRERKERGSEAGALWLLGEIASHQDPREVEKADSHYRQAMARDRAWVCPGPGSASRRSRLTVPGLGPAHPTPGAPPPGGVS